MVLAARRGKLLEELVAECEGLVDARAVAVPTDVSRKEGVEALARAALDNFGCIDIWINNAGAGALGSFEKVPLVEHKRVIATDLLGTLGEALNQELEQRELENVHVCTVMPTAPDTPFFDHAANYTSHEVHAPSPLQDPENVVQMILHLAQFPKDKKVIGADGLVKIVLKNVAPEITHAASAMQMHRH